MASSVLKQQVKMRRARKLAASRDVLVMQETHGNEGKCRALRTLIGYKAFWSNGTVGEAGVGAWIKEDFLKRLGKTY